MSVLRLGLRREVRILLPVSLLLLLALSIFTLLSYRTALDRLAGERRREAAQLAGAAAARLAPSGGLDEAELRQLARGGVGAAVAGPEGEVLLWVGDLPPAGLLDPLGGERPRGPVGVGLDGVLPDRVVGFAPLGGGRTLRVDLGAAVLGGQIRGVRVLSAVVVGIDAAVLVLLVVFLRHLLAPYETMLARARELRGGEEAGEASDEAGFLLETFEQALAALAAAPSGDAEEDDIATLQRTLVSSLESGVLLLDREGRVLALNPVGAELLALPPPAPGTPLDRALTPHPELRELLAGAVAEGTGVRRQECSAGERSLGLTVHPLRRDDGGVRGHLVLFADLTEVRRRSRDRRLAESLEQLGELAAGVAHELRNSLATLRGYLALIERHPEEESIADYLGEIRRETAQLQRIVEDFLAFARPGTARQREVDLVALARRAAADPALGGALVTVSGSAPPLAGDPQLLDRVLRNLLHNAVTAEREAGRPGGAQVRVAATADGVELAVEDRGPGVPEELRERLFHPFVTGRPGGVGLGLALAHRIVTLHGGSLRLEDRPGGGTRAAIRFPSDRIVTKGNDNEAPIRISESERSEVNASKKEV